VATTDCVNPVGSTTPGDESLSTMVNTTDAGLPSVAPPVGLLNVKVTVSLPSTAVSSRTVTVNVLLASPSAKVSVPLAAV
jgi:hypothetical protein